MAPKAAARSGGGGSPRAKAIGRIAAVLRESLEPLSQAEIAAATGLKDGGWLAGLLSQMVAAGDAIQLAGGFGVPAPAVGAME